MNYTLKSTFTQLGLELQAQALYGDGTFEVSKMVIGDGNGNVYEPSLSQTALVNQLDELNIIDVEENGNTYSFLATIPQDLEYEVREIGLVDSQDRLLWVTQCENLSPVNYIETVIVAQITVSQGVSVVMADGNIQMASKSYVENNFQALSQKDEPNGYCSLDGEGKVPVAKLPACNATVAYVTDTYSNGTSWYRVYSDGWCEQGGTYQGGTGGDNRSYTVSLVKTFRDSAYNITGLVTANGGSGSYTNTVKVISKAEASVEIRANGSETIAWDWVARGYVS